MTGAAQLAQPARATQLDFTDSRTLTKTPG